MLEREWECLPCMHDHKANARQLGNGGSADWNTPQGTPLLSPTFFRKLHRQSWAVPGGDEKGIKSSGISFVLFRMPLGPPPQRTSALRQRKARVPLPSIMWQCNAGPGGVSPVGGSALWGVVVVGGSCTTTTTMAMQTWPHKAVPTSSCLVKITKLVCPPKLWFRSWRWISLSRSKSNAKWDVTAFVLLTWVWCILTPVWYRLQITSACTEELKANVDVAHNLTAEAPS